MSRIVFHRPARVMPPQLPTEPVVLTAPPQPVGKDPASSWVMLLMPLLSSVSMAAYMISEGKKMLILLGISFVLLSIGATGGVRLQMRRARRRTKLRSRQLYLDHLAEVRKSAQRMAADQRTVAAWAQPSPLRLRSIAARRRRVWERRHTDPDFLRIRAGVGTAPLTTPIRLATRNDPTVEYDAKALAAAERVVTAAATVGGQPLEIDLAKASVVSILGPADQARALARALVCQVAVLHAPDDVAIAVAAGGQDWDWAKWLPHTHEPDAGAAAEVVPLVAEGFEGIADFLHRRAQRHADQRPVRAPLAPVNAAPEARRRLLVVLDGYDPRSAWARSPIAAQLLADAGPHSASTVICIVSRETDEPTRADIRVQVGADGSLRVEGRRADPRPQTVGAVADLPDTALCEATARLLAPLRLSVEGDEILERVVSLPGMIGIDDLDAFEPEEFWRRTAIEDVLAVPIGFDGEGRPLVLDLKESARGGMGPHGLVVGATGSGKSELLRTLVSGLAATHSPELLSFVLVDFKGGATFAGVTELPHVAGLITNLVDDLATVDRVREALQAEQQRRQRILRDAGDVDNVRDYQLRREAGQSAPDGRPLEPLPYLLVIVDEFGELLSRRPDFMDLFVQIGRVGRSLGMHLLLATQRLEEGRLRGLDANLSYRVCLRTFSAAESRTVLGTPDAYHLPALPGSAYLKVGGSVYERFRVAHVSGPFTPPDGGAEPGRTGTGAAYPAPAVFALRTPRPQEDQSRHPAVIVPPAPILGPTEMQVMVQRLCGHGSSTHQVWLPPLPAVLPLDALTGPVSVGADRGLSAHWWPGNGKLRLPLGVLDIPARQRQDPLAPDFAAEEGNLALVGAPQSGKSTFLRTLMLSAMLTHTPDELQISCLDFGGGTLAPFERTPHVSGVAGRSDPARARRLVAELGQLVAEREQMMRDHGIDSVGRLRERRAENRLPPGVRAPDAFLVIDNWGAARGELDGIDAAVLDLAHRGLGVGVHLVLTANRWADVRTALRDNFSARYELRLGDPAESEVNRRLARALGAVGPGRGLARPGLALQTALPRIDGQDTTEGLAEAQQDALDRISAAWSGACAPKVRMLPEEITTTELALLRKASQDAGTEPSGAAIGVGESDLEPVYVDLTDGSDPHLLVFGDSGAGKSSFLRTWLAAMTERYPAHETRFILVDYRRALLDAVPDAHLGAYAGDPEAATAYVAQVAAKLRERLPPANVTARRLRDRDWWQGPDLYVVVDDYDMVAGSRRSPLGELIEFLPQARDIGLHLVLARRVSGLTRTGASDPLLSRVREIGAGGLILSGDPREGALLGGQRAIQRPPGRGVLIHRQSPPVTLQTALHE